MSMLPPLTPRYPYVHLEVDAERSELAASELWDAGATGIEERDAGTLSTPEHAASQAVTLVASFANESEAQAALQQLGGLYPAHLQFVEGDGWRDAWKQYFGLQRIGPRLLVRPPWEGYAPQAGEQVVVLDPGRAFGTGTHASTRLVLQQLEAQLRGGERILDVGCGSGILGIAALLLGAAACDAVDTDAEALAVTQENAGINGVAERLQVYTTPSLPRGVRYDWVLANIEAGVLQTLAPSLVDSLAAQGTLVLSGILAEQEASVLSAYAALRHVATRREEDWVAIVLQPTPPA